MTMKQSILIASALLLVIFVQQGLAIKCFECNSHFNEGCSYDKVPSNFSVDCSAKQDLDERNKPIQYTFCRKVLQIIEFPVNQLPANTRIIRGCGYEARNYQNQCYKRHGFGGRQTVCACETGDHCNHSSTMKSSFMLIALISGAIAYLSH